jgi:cytochrome c oxidase assembly factor CtaG
VDVGAATERAPGVRAIAHAGILRRPWGWITEPLGAWIFHALALWLWHLPAFFGAALAAEPLHVLQHATFFGSALAFWWSVIGRGSRRPDAASVASLFTTMLHTGVLGALIAFAPTPGTPPRPRSSGSMRSRTNSSADS